MATTRTFTYTVSTPNHTVKNTDGARELEYQSSPSVDPHENILVRVVRIENADNGTTSGTITVTAA